MCDKYVQPSLANLVFTDGWTRWWKSLSHERPWHLTGNAISIPSLWQMTVSNKHLIIEQIFKTLAGLWQFVRFIFYFTSLMTFGGDPANSGYRMRIIVHKTASFNTYGYHNQQHSHLKVWYVEHQISTKIQWPKPAIESDPRKRRIRNC